MNKQNQQYPPIAGYRICPAACPTVVSRPSAIFHPGIVVTILVTLGLLLWSLASHAQQLVTYPVPQAVVYAMHNDDYTVMVRRPGGQWQDLYEYNVQVDLDHVQNASMVYFDFSGKVEVFVRKNNGDIHTVRIRALSDTIRPVKNGNTITFYLTRPENLSVEFNGDKLHNLHVFADVLPARPPDSAQGHVMYFGPGLHVPPDSLKGMYRVPSGTTVYVAGGAVVRGGFLLDHVRDVKILGRGIIDRAPEGVSLDHARDIEISGVTFIDPGHYTISGGSSDGLDINHVKTFSCKPWSDGIDLMSCSGVKIDRVFLRTSDDCIAIYGHRWKFYGNAENYTVTHSSLWADIAHPINIGIHGDTRGQGDTIRNLRFDNIRILEEDEDDPDYEGCMAITDGDLNLVTGVHFDHIRVDDFQEGKLINLRVVYNRKYNTAPGRGIRDVYFRDISYQGLNTGVSVIGGYDKDHGVENVHIRNLRINGRLVLNPEAGNIRTGPFVQGVVFEK